MTADDFLFLADGADGLGAKLVVILESATVSILSRATVALFLQHPGVDLVAGIVTDLVIAHVHGILQQARVARTVIMKQFGVRLVASPCVGNTPAVGPVAYFFPVAFSLLRRELPLLIHLRYDVNAILRG